MKKFAIIIGITMFLSACAVPYIAPESGPTSKLVLDAKSTYGSNSIRFAVNDGTGCGKVFKIKDQTQRTEYIIPANKEIFVTYGVVVGSAFCRVSGAFDSEEGKSYFVSGSGFDRCSTSAPLRKVAHRSAPHR